jgi:hypothetical protein
VIDQRKGSHLLSTFNTLDCVRQILKQLDTAVSKEKRAIAATSGGKSVDEIDLSSVSMQAVQQTISAAWATLKIDEIVETDEHRARQLGKFNLFRLIITCSLLLIITRVC